jgi:hypothetical protein
VAAMAHGAPGQRRGAVMSGAKRSASPLAVTSRAPLRFGSARVKTPWLVTFWICTAETAGRHAGLAAQRSC